MQTTGICLFEKVSAVEHHVMSLLIHIMRFYALFERWSASNEIQITLVTLQSASGLITGRVVQQNASKGAEVAIAVCPDPGPGFHVHVNPVSFLEKQHHPVGAVVGDVGGSRVFGGAHDSLAVLVQEQKAGVSTVSVGVEGEVVHPADWSCKDS